jgi:hypothetical protein
MKVRVCRHAYRVARTCHCQRLALRFYIVIHTAEDGY